MSSPDRTLGFVMLFTDLTERKAADAARRKFHESILQARRTLKRRIDLKADLALENLMSNVVENAQLAAMEIADGLDTARTPAMLESVRTSVARTTEVLAQLSIEPEKSEAEAIFSSAGVEHSEMRMTTASDLRAVLRQATAPSHERMHRHRGLAAAAAGSIAVSDYRLLLARLFGFHRAFEAVMEASARENLDRL